MHNDNERIENEINMMLLRKEEETIILLFKYCYRIMCKGEKTHSQPFECLRMDGMVGIDRNGWEWTGMDGEWTGMDGIWFGMDGNGWEWLGMDGNG